MTKKEFFALCDKATNPQFDCGDFNCGRISLISDKPFLNEEYEEICIYASLLFSRHENAEANYRSNLSKYTRWLKEYREANP